MKRVICLIAIALLALFSIACAGNADNATSAPQETTNSSPLAGKKYSLLIFRQQIIPKPLLKSLP